MNWRSAGVASRSPPSSGNDTALGGLESGSKGGIGNWDQFATNERKFNVRANYDENLYTTKLDVDNIDSDKRREAERIAGEIEGTVSSNIHVAEERNQQIQTDYDEEDLYSGVLTKDLKVRALKDNDADESKPSQQNFVAAKKEKVTEPAKDVTKKHGKKEPATKSEPAKVEDNTTESKKEVRPSDKKSVTKLKLNPKAKEFTFNPSAKSFTPSFVSPAAPQQPPMPPAGVLPHHP